MQDEKVVSYGILALSDVESHYSRTEQEILAVVWATEHYHLYVYGATLTIITGHNLYLAFSRVTSRHLPESIN